MSKVDEAKKLAAAKSGSKLVLIENMNHILKTAPANRQENIATYGDPTLPLAMELAPSISDFIFNLK